MSKPALPGRETRTIKPTPMPAPKPAGKPRRIGPRKSGGLTEADVVRR